MPALPAVAPPTEPKPGRERRKRHDGTDLDSVTNLAEFVQSFPASSEESPPEETAPAPVQLQVPPGPTPEQVIAEERGRRETAERELQGLQQQLQIDEAARRAVTEAQPKPTPQPTPPDPRVAEIQDVWFTDPARAQQLLDEMSDERTQRKLDEALGKFKEQSATERDLTDRRALGNRAFNESRAQLLAAGVPQADLDNHFKITALYTAVTLPPTAERPNKYYSAGGPLSADVLVEAWKDLFGGAAATPQPAPLVTPPPPPIIAPPGSSRPAPAAAAPKKDRAAPISADKQRDLTYLAERLGHKPENLIARQRARMEKGS